MPSTPSTLVVVGAAALALILPSGLGLATGQPVQLADPRKCLAVEDAQGQVVYTVCVPYPIAIG